MEKPVRGLLSCYISINEKWYCKALIFVINIKLLFRKDEKSDY